MRRCDSHLCPEPAAFFRRNDRGELSYALCLGHALLVRCSDCGTTAALCGATGCGDRWVAISPTVQRLVNEVTCLPE